jgi:hypothetical protein
MVGDEPVSVPIMLLIVADTVDVVVVLSALVAVASLFFDFQSR